MKKVLIGIICFVLWCLISVPWYVCGIKGLCYEDAVKVDDTERIKETDVSNKEQTSIVKSKDTVALKETKKEAVVKEKPAKFSIEKAVILFPFGDTKTNISEEQKDNFRKLVKEITASDATLILTGYADTVGAVQKNMEVGKMRAEWLKQVFVSLGLDANRIITKSEGKNMVIRGTDNAVNMTDSRRVEIIVKQK